MGERGDLQLVTAAPDHASGVAALHGKLFEKAWDAEGVRRLLEHPACLGLVALEPAGGSAIVGFVIAQLAAGEGEILSLGVDPGWQRRGLGSRLVATIVETARSKDVHRLFLDVAESNSAAIGLYARLGFTQMGRRKAYYAHADGSREDALLMVRDVRAASR